MNCRIVTIVLVLWSLSGISTANAQGTAFSYQGRLTVNGAPATGLYSFQFVLRQTSNGAQQGPTLTTNEVPVTNGLFTAILDFGDYFGTREFALEIGVRTNGSVAPFTILSPRQPITPAPLAVAANHAGSASMAETVSAAGLPASVPQLDANARMRINGSLIVGPDPLYSQGFEAGSFPPAGWTTGGSANWIRTNSTSFEGNFSAVSGPIGNSQLSYLEFVYDFPVQMLVKFNWKVSSELSDFLHFSVDGNPDPAGANPISGEVNWTPVTVSISAGIHTLRWMYLKDETFSLGSNRAWIDNVRFVTAEGNVQVSGSIAALELMGNGAGVSNINGATLTGTIPDARLSPNVAVRGGGNAFTGNQTIAGTVGIGTVNPQGNVHVYSTSNPTTMRIQSTGTPGFGRIEFVSNPQGDPNEWRPGYIQSTDNGGFTGGLGFFVNGTGNTFGSMEAMRIVNGRVGIGTPTPSSALQVVGTVTATAFNPPSDRALKENFAPVLPRDVLEKVATMPISRWNFKGDAATPHIGPMAQDFHAAFGLGTDERHIATVDADGVALAAIQGLNEVVKEKDAKISSLEKRLCDLEAMVKFLAEKR